MIKDTSDGMFTFNIGTAKYKMGSKLFPLESKKLARPFLHENTSEVDDKEFMDAIDCLVMKEMGRCYTYAQAVYEVGKMLERNVVFYSGWLFVESRPIHHAWVVMDGNKVIDVTLGKDYFMKSTMIFKGAKESGLTEEEYRKLHLQYSKEEHRQRVSHLSKYSIMGKVPEGMLYVGCPSTRHTAIKTFNDMIDAYPDHPCYKRTRIDGRSELQYQMHKELKEEGFYED